ncbi:MAG: hypothetical protein JW841_13240 [Deltaproteobacteria bacterium]|nr:hypothetical protein [Deltaproteobacteria bacterium]
MHLLLVALLFTISPMASAANLSGNWEVQSIGTDRQITIKQKGKKITAHRVLWPEFEGHSYKLEHLYRGNLIGKTIKGKLFVREEGQKDYEMLRPFIAEVISNDRINFDGLPIKRIVKPIPVTQGAILRFPPNLVQFKIKPDLLVALNYTKNNQKINAKLHTPLVFIKP